MSNTSKISIALGLMSGTSYDGIDAGIIETDGQDYVKLIEGNTKSYPQNLKTSIEKLLRGNYKDIWQVEHDISQLHAEMANEYYKKYKFDVIGFHGQAIYHNPNSNITIQIGNPHIIQKLVKTDIVYDFRRRDVAAGGQGAPLVPIFLNAINPYKNRPTCFLNIGGVSNICYISNDELIAFDVGVGNAPLDDLCKYKLNIDFDKNGTIASTGKIDERLLKILLTNSYFKRNYPKSLDRNHFDFDLLKDIPIENALATIVEFIASGIKLAILKLPTLPNEIIVSGGGVHNSYLMQRICELTNIPVEASDKYNLNSNYLEAYAFAYLAVRSIKNLPISFPNTTGVSSPQTGGVLIKKI